MSSVSAALTPENQVILRNIEHLPTGRVLLVDAMPDSAIKEFQIERPDIEWVLYSPYIDTADTLSLFKSTTNTAITVFKSAWINADQTGQFDAIVIYYPKTKQRFELYVSMTSQLLKTDGEFFVVGEKKGGVKSAEKGLKNVCLGSKKIDSARHCMLYFGKFNNQPCTKGLEDWFSFTELEVTVGANQQTLKLASLPGVFSATRLDNGTELLLANMTQPSGEGASVVQGEGIDFGVGCGVISAALCKLNECKITGIDVDIFAVESSNRTFEINNVQANAVHSNGLANLMNQKNHFDFIVSNPPFHTGLKTDYSIVEQFLKNSATLLKSKYQMWVVANSFLPYPELFKKYLKPAKSIINNKKFTVYKL